MYIVTLARVAWCDTGKCLQILVTSLAKAAMKFLWVNDLTYSSMIIYQSDIRTFTHKGYNTMFNLYVQPNRAYKSLRCLVNI